MAPVRANEPRWASRWPESVQKTDDVAGALSTSSAEGSPAVASVFATRGISLDGFFTERKVQSCPVAARQFEDDGADGFFNTSSDFDTWDPDERTDFQWKPPLVLPSFLPVAGQGSSLERTSSKERTAGATPLYHISQVEGDDEDPIETARTRSSSVESFQAPSSTSASSACRVTGSDGAYLTAEEIASLTFSHDMLKQQNADLLARIEQLEKLAQSAPNPANEKPASDPVSRASKVRVEYFDISDDRDMAEGLYLAGEEHTRLSSTPPSAHQSQVQMLPPPPPVAPVLPPRAQASAGEAPSFSPGAPPASLPAVAPRLPVEMHGPGVPPQLPGTQWPAPAIGQPLPAAGLMFAESVIPPLPGAPFSCPMPVAPPGPPMFADMPVPAPNLFGSQPPPNMMQAFPGPGCIQHAPPADVHAAPPCHQHHPYLGPGCPTPPVPGIHTPLPGQPGPHPCAYHPVPAGCPPAEPVYDTLPAPKPEVGTIGCPTRGSVGHFRGKCKPCAFFHSKGCESGIDCEFCHLCPPGEKRRRQREKYEVGRLRSHLWKTAVAQAIAEEAAKQAAACQGQYPAAFMQGLR
eukprot:TRINITY_DN9995_c0_g1_i1.p1 TRINITY_DN9995_c0_g1~~TRINITY_DN9995_c0_g1_i1.p1  ORF type:complete len:598 (+),score=95.53 TRINITY_DN9995_c0_g1_i1:64-1794(+)